MEVREPLRRSFDAVWPSAGTGSRSRPADIHHCAGAVLTECCAGVTCSYHFREVPRGTDYAGRTALLRSGTRVRVVVGRARSSPRP